MAPVVLGKKPSAADLVRQAISAAVDRIMRHDPGVRIGDDPEDVHQARVGTRRLRSDLRTFSSLLDEEWLASLRDELRWLAGALGEVRDDDVLIDAPPAPGGHPARAGHRRPGADLPPAGHRT